MANIYKNAKLDLTTASETTLYAVPSDSRAIVKSILVCDDSNNGSTLTVTITDASSNVFVLFAAIAFDLNKENTAELAFVTVIVILSPLPESSDTNIFLIIALEPDGVV